MLLWPPKKALNRQSTTSRTLSPTCRRQSQVYESRWVSGSSHTQTHLCTLTYSSGWRFECWLSIHAIVFLIFFILLITLVYSILLLLLLHSNIKHFPYFHFIYLELMEILFNLLHFQVLQHLHTFSQRLNLSFKQVTRLWNIELEFSFFF